MCLFKQLIFIGFETFINDIIEFSFSYGGLSS